ncbi:MAG: hypothetical protein IH948_09535 [Bacteroidetes bacterium]|nr:hypothetical protein [Bacteroidota bacterium]
MPEIHGQPFTIGDVSKTYMYETEAYVSDLYQYSCPSGDTCYIGHHIDSIDSSGINTVYYFNKFLRDATFGYGYSTTYFGRNCL